MSLRILKLPWEQTKPFAALATSLWNHKQDEELICETYYQLCLPPNPGFCWDFQEYWDKIQDKLVYK